MLRTKSFDQAPSCARVVPEQEERIAGEEGEQCRRQRRSLRETLDRRLQLEDRQRPATGHRRGIECGVPPVADRQLQSRDPSLVTWRR
jgi:hypothetical protein